MLVSYAMLFAMLVCASHYDIRHQYHLRIYAILRELDLRKPMHAYVQLTAARVA